MAQINDLIKQIADFCEVRDWKQFHNPKDVSISLVLEATEVMEHFQWKNKEEMEKYVTDAKNEIGEELADVFYWLLLLSHDLNIDLLAALENKMKKNAEKYPVEKAKGRHDKYSDL